MAWAADCRRCLPTAAGGPSPVRDGRRRVARRTYFSAQIEEVYPGPEQPRHNFDEAKLVELADSIKVHGVIVPLVVRPRPEGGYFLIAGERRWRAAQRAGLHEVPVVVQEVDAQVAFERALVENLQRADLGPLEEATAFQRLVDEFGLTQDQVAERIGKDRSTVANAIRLLEAAARRAPDGRGRAAVDGPRPRPARSRRAPPRSSAPRARWSTRACRSARPRRWSRRLARPSRAEAARTPVQKSASVRDLEERLTRRSAARSTITEDEPGKAGTDRDPVHGPRPPRAPARSPALSRARAIAALSVAAYRR